MWLNKVNFKYIIKSCGLIALKLNSIKPYNLTACLYEKNEGIYNPWIVSDLYASVSETFFSTSVDMYVDIFQSKIFFFYN